MDTGHDASAGKDEAQPGEVGCRLVPVGSGSVWRVPCCKLWRAWHPGAIRRGLGQAQTLQGKRADLNRRWSLLTLFTLASYLRRSLSIDSRHEQELGG
ncbi:hypothetical protein LEL_07968 [Akanthomyces lecanii RCEF 1005]|uniref:Uncharacterized protein n=1 Tax=Akanthomyces lecanii RCEF 1005 TaxID=1081108 RepID=A0A168EY14_CORDF|nr:hypothetical protein LEL_07968 [Akanthomyces lecanii RCEF 1005]